MTQQAWIILSLRIVIIAAVASISAFVACYSRWAPWWKDPIGRTLVIKDLLLIAALAVFVLSLFFQFNRLSSAVAAWLDVAVFAAITPVMCWRIAVFWKIHREGRPPAAWPLPLLLARRYLRSCAAPVAARLRRRPPEQPGEPGA